ncbi:hypothetical protein AVEN_234339-1 [Araneus ventricosus]|uniref:DUF5641 domain-containing protein n=1 Tax=Araneus ventricosus TaxID=182803 RepID=A0A4Y2A9U6_ARAVE|nr:hypothetical protein AVEN_234339-1 [Araneus ventricosus]
MSLSTDNIILALRRFTAHRGHISITTLIMESTVHPNGYLFEEYQPKKIKNIVYSYYLGIFLLRNENLKRIHLPVGRILSIYTSKDGIVRKARIKTKSGTVIKPIRNLCPLELDGESLIINEVKVPGIPDDPETQDIPESNTVTTRTGQ